MNYPFWEIPILGSGWVIGIIAIFHVMISQFAVGGGLYLPMAERKAMRIPPHYPRRVGRDPPNSQRKQPYDRPDGRKRDCPRRDRR